MFILLSTFHILLFLVSDSNSAGILYPKESETREILSLDGLWQFTFSNSSRAEKWYNINFAATNELPIQTMAVPSSYNDIGTDTNFRDYVGAVWYQKSFFAPKSWKNQKVWIRFSSVCRLAEVWINGQEAVSHDIGHLPFQSEVSSLLNFGEENLISVSVDNTLLNTTIPQGRFEKLASGRIRQYYSIDFFNYAGIDRPVVLYTTPATYIDDITVTTAIDGTNGFVNYSVAVEGPDTVVTKVSLLDKTDTVVATDTVLDGSLFVKNATFWWPYLMDANPGYLYSLVVQLFDTSNNLLDQYVLPIGIRTITWDSKSVKINNKNVYLRGFGRHEDSDIRGKGLDLSLIIRDYNLIRWIGANSFRTSHYPYAEEIMDLADQYGIMIIDECPSVNTKDFSEELLENHKKSLSELIQRDKNRPSVIMWSGANEPTTQYDEAESYFREIVAHIKSLDTTRPVTVVNFQSADVEHSGQFLDVASYNRYEGWGSNVGSPDVVVENVKKYLSKWHELHNIPVLMSEYGAESLQGSHSLPAYAFSEEYQEEVLSKYFQAFDELREEGFLIGEHIWNFADFKTDQRTKRVGGNRKGIFTRDRQPKASAHLIRRRYWALAKALDNVEGPEDLESYVIAN